MRKSEIESGYFQSVLSYGKKYVAAAALAAFVTTGSVASLNTSVHAAGDTRSLRIYHVHTKESLSVTYMKDGRYVPSAMKQINYILRDWRRNEVITIDPKTIDLMYQLHADLGSSAPIHIVSGYRSPRTNAFLKKIGRNVANKSQHMLGKAIDIFFPDVNTKKIRNNALVMQLGGVGYYSSAGGPTGFVHIDSGRVRHWGPAISNKEMAQIFRSGRKFVPHNNKQNTQEIIVADAKSGAKAKPGFFSNLLGKKGSSAQPEPEQGYDGLGDENISAMAAKAVANEDEDGPAESQAESQETVAPTPVATTVPVPAAKPEQIALATVNAPKPRPKPAEVIAWAAEDVRVQHQQEQEIEQAIAQSAPAQSESAQVAPAPAITQAPPAQAIAQAAPAKTAPAKTAPVQEIISQETTQQPALPNKVAVATTQVLAAQILAAQETQLLEQAAKDQTALSMASLGSVVTPASAPPDKALPARQTKRLGNSKLSASQRIPAANLAEETDPALSKGDLASELRDGTAEDVPIINGVVAHLGNVSYPPQSVLTDTQKHLRRNGAPQPFAQENGDAALVGEEPLGLKNTRLPDDNGANDLRDGKGDLLVLDDKGDLPTALH